MLVLFGAYVSEIRDEGLRLEPPRDTRRHRCVADTIVSTDGDDVAA